MACVSETVAQSDSNHRLELHPLLFHSIVVGDKHSRIVLEACGEGDVQYFGEAVGEVGVPVHVEIAELAVEVGVAVVHVPSLPRMGRLVGGLDVISPALVWGVQHQSGTKRHVVVFVRYRSFEKEAELGARVVVLDVRHAFYIQYDFVGAVLLLQVAAEIIILLIRHHLTMLGGVIPVQFVAHVRRGYTSGDWRDEYGEVAAADRMLPVYTDAHIGIGRCKKLGDGRVVALFYFAADNVLALEAAKDSEVQVFAEFPSELGREIDFVRSLPEAIFGLVNPRHTEIGVEIAFPRYGILVIEEVESDEGQSVDGVLATARPVDQPRAGGIQTYIAVKLPRLDSCRAVRLRGQARKSPDTENKKNVQSFHWYERFDYHVSYGIRVKNRRKGTINTDMAQEKGVRHPARRSCRCAKKLKQQDFVLPYR